MSQNTRAVLCVFCFSLAIVGMPISYWGWEAHFTLGESHGPFGFVGLLGHAFTILGGWAAWRLYRDYESGT